MCLLQNQIVRPEIRILLIETPREVVLLLGQHEQGAQAEGVQTTQGKYPEGV